MKPNPFENRIDSSIVWPIIVMSVKKSPAVKCQARNDKDLHYFWSIPRGTKCLLKPRYSAFLKVQSGTLCCLSKFID